MPRDPAAAAAGGGGEDAILFGVAATLVYDVLSATNSSPQTTELFASQRAGTLWKYVRLGGVQAGILVAIMALRSRSLWAAGGGAIAGYAMWRMYDHALAAGGGQKPPVLAGQSDGG